MVTHRTSDDDQLTIRGQLGRRTTTHPWEDRRLVCHSVVETTGFEPATSALQGRRSPN
jgi:hypothetical protein